MKFCEHILQEGKGFDTSVSLKTDWRIVPMGKHVNVGDKND